MAIPPLPLPHLHDGLQTSTLPRRWKREVQEQVSQRSRARGRQGGGVKSKRSPNRCVPSSSFDARQERQRDRRISITRDDMVACAG